MPNALSRLLAPFMAKGRVSKALIAIFLFVTGIVLLNAGLHDPAIGYDSPEHLAYIQTLAQGRLPTPADTAEYFCPPLPYALPAWLMSTGMADLWQAAKAAQFVNVLLSAGLLYYLISICDLIRPDDIHLKLGATSLLAILPVYYKTMAFVRGEPYVAFFSVFTTHQALLVFLKGSHRRRDGIALGVGIGLLVLSRQWGLLLLPAIVLFVAVLALKARTDRRQLLGALALSLAIGLAIGSTHYIHLFMRYGTLTPFNREPSNRFALSNQPAIFYYGTGSGRLFTAPVRESFPNQFWPILYSETWGDYWEYFVVWGRDVRTGDLLQGSRLQHALLSAPAPTWLQTNKDQVQGYLGRVNLVSLLPSLLLVAGFALGVADLARLLKSRSPAPEGAAYSLLVLLIAASFAGYLWLVITFPRLKKGADNVKATYVLQVFPPLAVLGGEFLRRLRARVRPAYGLILLLLALVCAHNLPAMITHYVR